MNEEKVDHGSSTYDRVAHLYDRTRGWPREVEWVIGAVLYYLVAEATRRDEPRVLEVGAGTGRVAVPLAAHGACVCGIDVSREMLARLSAKSARLVRAGFPQRVSASMADALELPFPEGVFDAGLVVHVLHRLPDWRRGLAELRRVVRPDGAFVFGIDEGEQDPADWVDRRWSEIVAEEGGSLEPPALERVAAAYEAGGVLEQEAIHALTPSAWLLGAVTALEILLSKRGEDEETTSSVGTYANVRRRLEGLIRKASTGLLRHERAVHYYPWQQRTLGLDFPAHRLRPSN